MMAASAVSHERVRPKSEAKNSPLKLLLDGEADVWDMGLQSPRSHKLSEFARTLFETSRPIVLSAHLTI